MHIENIYHLYFFRFIVTFFVFFIQSRYSVNDSPRLKFTLCHFSTKPELDQKIKSIPLIDVSKLP